MPIWLKNIHAYMKCKMNPIGQLVLILRNIIGTKLRPSLRNNFYIFTYKYILYWSRILKKKTDIYWLHIKNIFPYTEHSLN